MFAFLEGLPLGGISATTLLGLWVLLVMLGKIPTSGQHKDLAADRDHWRSSADKWQEVALKQGMTLERLVTYAETADHMLRELQRAADRDGGNP